MSQTSSSVIHNPSTSNGDPNATIDEIISEDEARKRREQLNRRPSYRMILKDLETVDRHLKRDPDDSPQISVPHSASAVITQMADRVLASHSGIDSYAPSTGGVSLLQSNGDLINPYSASSVAVAAAAAAAAMARQVADASNAQNNRDNGGIEVSRSSGGPLLLPVNSDLLGLKPMQDAQAALAASSAAANFAAANSEWSSSMLSYDSSPSPVGMMGGRASGTDNDESSRKRQVRLLKNREAAKECRRKKKEYVKCLENRVAVLENQNKALIEELKTLKELYCRKEKGD